MRGDESLPIVLDKRHEVGLLIVAEVDLADSKEEDRVEVVQVSRKELLARGNPGADLECDLASGNQLGIGADDRVVDSRLASQPLDGGQRMRNGVVLIPRTDIGPG